jgi:hypothetical protein
MSFVIALAISLSFWGARGVHVPCQPVAVLGADSELPVMDEWGNIAAMGTYVETCRILISSDVDTYRSDRDLAPLYCQDVAHEVGHIGGLEHTETGLMAPAPDWTSIPYECVHWWTWARRHGFKPPRRLRPEFVSRRARGNAAS